MLFESKHGLAATFGILLNKHFELNNSLGRLRAVSHFFFSFLGQSSSRARAKGDRNINLHILLFRSSRLAPEEKRMTARCLELEVSDETPAREPAGRQLGQASQERFYASQQKD